ncbi:hypothetical protein GDO78_016358 [Eleutherodactylus coqui]|uniref:Coilin n=1 Tax=Eleutherodactylus coqui TaxID=57060 RepID=A0A8J6BBC5_ELECQ|nr:hypothetical protein GDO78_016358 [Eleutherodactylus coqui]
MPSSAAAVMAAPGGELRVRLLFDYPPPALPLSRQLWFMLDTELCRAVTDVSAIIRERFFYSRQGALSLYLDGCLLPPGESVRVIRDNEAISVRWEDTCGHGGGKRRRLEEGSGDPRVHRGASEERGEETPEKEEVHQRRKKRKKVAVTPIEDSKRPKKKNKEAVTPAEDSGRPKEYDNGAVTPTEVSGRPKKNKVVVTPTEVSGRPKKSNGAVTPIEANKWPKKKQQQVMTPEVASERPKKYNNGVVTPTEVSRGPKKHKEAVTAEEASRRPSKEKARSPQQDSELAAGASEKKDRRPDVSKKPPRVAPYQAEPSRAVQKEAPPPANSSAGQETSSSSSDEEDTRTEKPGPFLKAQQEEEDSSLEGFLIKKPLMCGFAVNPPVYNGQVARGGAQHRPSLKTAGRGIGRGWDVENLPWRGRGFRGRGKVQLQNTFFYSYSPETVKQQHLEEDVSHVSVLIQNPPELLKKDYSALPLLAAAPQPGNIIAFKLLELTENYTPEVSDYKEGRVLAYDPLSQQLEVEVLSQQKKKEPGKFDLVYEGEDGVDIVEYAVPQECKITQAWSSLIEPRLVTEHGPQQQLSAAPQGD